MSVNTYWSGSTAGSFIPGSSTPFGIYDSDSEFRVDAPKTATWVAKRLGYPIINIELDNEQIFTCFEESTSEYSAQVNQFNIRNNIDILRGQRKVPNQNYSQTLVDGSFLPTTIRMSQQYGTLAGVGGNTAIKKAYIDLIPQQQIYNIMSASVDVATSSSFATLFTGSSTVDVTRVFHEATPAIARFFDPYSVGAQGTLNLMSELGFGQFSPAAQFLMMPLYEDVLRMQQIEFNDHIRKSAFSFNIVNNKFRIIYDISPYVTNIYCLRKIFTYRILDLSKTYYSLIHIRYGDKIHIMNKYLGTPKFDYFLIYTPQYYIDMINMLLHKNPNKKIIILSDSFDIINEFIINKVDDFKNNPNIILMDEPTAALSATEVERLMTVMKSLKAANKAVIFVSHRLDEVFAISDFITVMRDGATVSDNPVEKTDLQKVIKEMVGRELTEMFPKTENKIGSVVLEVNDLTNPAYFRNISFNVKKGEIVALAGLVGAGRSEVARAIFGVDKYETGSVKINGKALPAGSPVAAMKEKIALVPEDRRQQGLFMVAGVNRNISIESFTNLVDKGLINFKRERELTNTWKEKLSIKFSNQNDPVERLSGGNQQKTVLAKWLATDPDLLIVDEPTRGIDVATKAEVHRLINQAASEGKAVLMISSELPEVLGMADRIIVMREGRQVAELSRKEATQEKVISAATTGKKSA